VSDTPNPELTDEELSEFRAFLAERKARADRAAAAPPGVGPSPRPAVPDDGVAYIRGGAGMAVDTARAVRIVVSFGLVALAVLVILLTVSAFHQNSRLSRLAHHGVPVDVTVTTCLGISSGTGVTEYQFTCRGSFTLDGRTYNEVIGGTSALHQPGAVLQALTIPGDPALLSVTSAVVHRHNSKIVFITPVILLVVLVAGVVVFVWLLRRNRNDGAGPHGAISPAV
jgi:hypothetical protein